MKILVLQLQEVGDSLVMTPVLRALKRYYPQARIDLVVSPAGWNVHQKSPYVRRMYLHDRGTSHWGSFMAWVRVLRAIRHERYNCVLSCVNQTSRRYPLLAWFTGAIRRIGFDDGGLAFLYTQRLPMPSKENVVQANLRLVAAVTDMADIQRCDPRLSCPYDAHDVHMIDDLLRARQVPSQMPLAAVHVGANWHSKTWYPDRWAAVVDGLGRAGYHPVFVGTLNDMALVDAVRTQVTVETASVVGATTIPELAALLSRCAVFVGTDSGPRHVAAAVDAPRVTVMSSLDDPTRWTFDTSSEIVLRSDPPCHGCLRSMCDHRTCMTLISVDQVLDACRRVVASSHARDVASGSFAAVAS